jgi:hypothetical protein
MHQRIWAQAEHWVLHGLGRTELPRHSACWSQTPSSNSLTCDLEARHGNHVIQRVWTQGPQSYLAANTHQDAISGDGSQDLQTPPQQFAFLLQGEEVVEITWFGGVYTQSCQTHLAANTHSLQGWPWRLNTMSAMTWCFVSADTLR